MGRLFDAGQRERVITEQRDKREGVRERAEAVDRILKENLELSEESEKLGEQLRGSEPQSVLTVQYKSHRTVGSKWKIEHASVGNDYVYQVFALRPYKLHWKDVFLLFVNEMEQIFPRSVIIKYSPPSERFELKYWTIRVTEVTGLPGWEIAKVRALEGLSNANAWPNPQG